MDASALLGQWASAAAVVRTSSFDEPSVGDSDQVFPWASVSKLAVAAVTGTYVQRGEIRFDDQLGPEGSTVAHVLSHSSGLGPSHDSLGARVGAKRIYSTYGYELLVERCGGIDRFVSDCQSIFGLTSVASDGSAAGGLNGNLTDLKLLVRAWMGNGPLDAQTLVTMTSVFLPDIDGVVPGFGSFQPCPWALGPQVKGSHHHWMGSNWPSRAFGHFGQSGSIVLIDRDLEFAVVALSSRPFGPWAAAAWSEWTSRVYELAP